MKSLLWSCLVAAAMAAPWIKLQKKTFGISSVKDVIQGRQNGENKPQEQITKNQELYSMPSGMDEDGYFFILKTFLKADRDKNGFITVTED